MKPILSFKPKNQRPVREIITAKELEHEFYHMFGRNYTEDETEDENITFSRLWSTICRLKPIEDIVSHREILEEVGRKALERKIRQFSSPLTSWLLRKPWIYSQLLVDTKMKVESDTFDDVETIKAFTYQLIHRRIYDEYMEEMNDILNEFLQNHEKAKQCPLKRWFTKSQSWRQTFPSISAKDIELEMNLIYGELRPIDEVYDLKSSLQIFAGMASMRKNMILCRLLEVKPLYEKRDNEKPKTSPTKTIPLSARKRPQPPRHGWNPWNTIKGVLNLTLI